MNQYFLYLVTLSSTLQGYGPLGTPCTQGRGPPVTSLSPPKLLVDKTHVGILWAAYSHYNEMREHFVEHAFYAPKYTSKLPLKCHIFNGNMQKKKKTFSTYIQR